MHVRFAAAHSLTMFTSMRSPVGWMARASSYRLLASSNWPRTSARRPRCSSTECELGKSELASDMQNWASLRRPSAMNNSPVGGEGGRRVTKVKGKRVRELRVNGNEVKGEVQGKERKRGWWREQNRAKRRKGEKGRGRTERKVKRGTEDTGVKGRKGG